MPIDTLSLVTEAVQAVGTVTYEERIRFIHWEIPNTEGGRCTIAFKVDTDRKNSKRHVKYAIAYCNPNDCFFKKKGRWISAGRLNKNPQYTSFDYDSTQPFHDQIVKFLTDIALENVPVRWATIKAQEELLHSIIVTKVKHLPDLCVFKVINTGEVYVKHPKVPILGFTGEEDVLIAFWAK